MWSKTLGGDSAVKLLLKLGLLEQCVDYAAETGAFSYAFELCKHPSLSDKMPDIYLKHAMHL